MSTNGIASDGDLPKFDASGATTGVEGKYASALLTQLNEFENFCKAALDGIEAADDEAKRLRSLCSLVDEVNGIVTQVITHTLTTQGVEPSAAPWHAKVLAGDLIRNVLREGATGGGASNAVAAILRTIKA